MSLEALRNGTLHMVYGVLQGLQNDVLHTVCSWYDCPCWMLSQFWKLALLINIKWRWVRLAPRERIKGKGNHCRPGSQMKYLEFRETRKRWLTYKNVFRIIFKNLGCAVSSLPSALVPTCLLRSENISVKIRARRSRACSDGCQGFLSTFYYSKQRFITAPGCDRS